MRIFNPTNKEVVFLHGGMGEIIGPGEVREIDDRLRVFFLEQARELGLVEYSGQIAVTNIDYKAMPWRELVSLASKRGVFKPGASRKATMKAMEDYEQTRRTLQEPVNKEEGEGA